MSNFNVTLWRVAEIKPHPNADRLELLHLHDLTYQFVVGKGEFAVGQLVAYFPLDSLIPNGLASILGLPVKEDKPFRIKSMRLRQEWSEGVIAPLTKIGLDDKLAFEQMDITEQLGVTKYEPPEFDANIFKGFGGRSAWLQALPVGVHKYDIENLQRFPALFDQLRDEVVVVTEKLEGSHWWARIDKDGQTIHVGQRNFEIRRESAEEPAVDNEGMHPFWNALYVQNLDDFLRFLSRTYPGYNVTIRGEFVGAGVQGNYYDFVAGQRTVFLFEVELDGTPVDAGVFLSLAAEAPPKARPAVVPVLHSYLTLGELAPTLEDAIALGHGQSLLAEKLREGIVIKPRTEKYSPEIGRAFIKVRDAAYLAQ